MNFISELPKTEGTSFRVFEYVSEEPNQADVSVLMAIDDKVYDVKSFLENHPGGAEILTELKNRDGTQDFDDIGHSNSARDILKDLQIGVMNAPKPKPVKPQNNSEWQSGMSLMIAMGVAFVIPLSYYYYSQIN